MTIKTLEFIHELLEEEKGQRRKIYDKANENLRQATDEGKEEDVLEALDDIKMCCYRKYLQAINALEDFEKEEW